MDWLLKRIGGGEIDFSRIRGGNVDFLIFDRFDVFLGSLKNENCRLEALRSWRVLARVKLHSDKKHVYSYKA